MPSAFDTLRQTVFGQVKQTFGYPAKWESADGNFSFEGTVLFNQPNAEDELGNVVYNPEMYWMDFPLEDFQGLKALVDKAETTEIVEIDGRCFQVMQVTATADGNQYRAEITEIFDNEI